MGLVGAVIYSQCFADDTEGVTHSVLSSNVVAARFVM
jgi:hypothetical protein